MTTTMVKEGFVPHFEHMSMPCGPYLKVFLEHRPFTNNLSPCLLLKLSVMILEPRMLWTKCWFWRVLDLMYKKKVKAKKDLRKRMDGRILPRRKWNPLTGSLSFSPKNLFCEIFHEAGSSSRCVCMHDTLSCFEIEWATKLELNWWQKNELCTSSKDTI